MLLCSPSDGCEHCLELNHGIQGQLKVRFHSPSEVMSGFLDKLLSPYSSIFLFAPLRAFVLKIRFNCVSIILIDLGVCGS